MTTVTYTLHRAVNGDSLIVRCTTYTPGWLGRLFGRTQRRRTRRFVGHGTIWRELPDFVRSWLWRGIDLYEVEARLKYKARLEAAEAREAERGPCPGT